MWSDILLNNEYIFQALGTENNFKETDNCHCLIEIRKIIILLIRKYVSENIYVGQRFQQKRKNPISHKYANKNEKCYMPQ